MSTLYTDNIRANNASQITLPTGQKIVGTDSGSIVAPGHVIQVQKATVNSRTTFTSTAYITSGLAINFTPKFTNSMLHVVCTGTLADDGGQATTGAVFRRVISGTTSYSPLGNTAHGNINSPDGATMAAYQGNDGAGNNKQSPFTMEWFDDTHNTTGQITYTVMVANNGSGSNTTAFGGLGNQNEYNIVSTLSVWEIAQ